MITSIICKCECNKEFIINISKTNNLDNKSIKIYNKWNCPKCNDVEAEDE